MKRTFLAILIALIAVLLLVAAGAYLFPLGKAPLGIQGWAPLPVACVNYSCATFAELGGEKRYADTGGRTDLDILTALVGRRMDGIIASRAGIKVTREEVRQAIDASRRILAETRGTADIFEKIYGANEGRTERYFRDAILREKIVATSAEREAGADAIKVRVLSPFVRWNAGEKAAVMRRPYPMLAGDGEMGY